jgi:hypothetical protein
MHAPVSLKKAFERDELQPAGRPERTPDHDALMREIAADARTEPERYLAESIVPEGGE